MNLSRLRNCRTACAVLLLCTATAIASPAQTFLTLLDFNGTDGSLPLGPLTQNADGTLYGTTLSGGANGYGTVFKLAPGTGTLTTLYSFCSQTRCPDGSAPAPGLALATDGNFYGTSSSTLFKITPSGTLTTLHTFLSTDGTNPNGGLIQAADGNLYGTTSYGGTGTGCPFIGRCGTVFKITPGGTLTTLHSFRGVDGGEPLAGLVQATDGNFYGTTFAGGVFGQGTVFKMTSGGALTTLHSFSATDGGSPYTALVQATDGNLYGTTLGPIFGTVFSITPGGTLTTIHAFNGTDGSTPFAALIQATDGNLYGATTGGGADGQGTVFKITLSGTLTTLHNFCSQTGCTDGYGPIHTLFQYTNGKFYGATPDGGTNSSCSADGCGTLFALAVGLGPFVRTLPVNGKVGAQVRIFGNGLTTATSVTFNGTPATFAVVSSTLIRATVPSGATTGTVQVTTPSGTLSSNLPFRVR
jgi:uncharacterized repeat protein (TIGR03803 family)